MVIIYICIKLVSTRYKRGTILDGSIKEYVILYLERTSFIVFFYDSDSANNVQMIDLVSMYNKSQSIYEITGGIYTIDSMLSKCGTYFYHILLDLWRHGAWEDDKLISYIYASICWGGGIIAGLFSFSQDHFVHEKNYECKNSSKMTMLVTILGLPWLASIKLRLFTCLLFREMSTMTWLIILVMILLLNSLFYHKI